MDYNKANLLTLNFDKIYFIQIWTNKSYAMDMNNIQIVKSATTKFNYRHYVVRERPCRLAYV
jgi:hypothetical protein